MGARVACARCARALSNSGPICATQAATGRHGPVSYINRQLVERVRALKDLLADAGSVHEFELEGKHVPGRV